MLFKNALGCVFVSVVPFLMSKGHTDLFGIWSRSL